MSTEQAIDHTRGLCGKPDVPNDTPRSVIERNPAHCRCCGSEMCIEECTSMGMQQLGMYVLLCPICPCKEVSEMVTNGESLEAMEKMIREKAEDFKAANAVVEEKEKILKKAVADYKIEREKLQREAWAKEKLSWCQRCNKFYPQKSIGLLYTEGREWHGSEYTESYAKYRKIRSFCEECVEIMLSRPRGGEDEFQGYKAKKKEDGFVIFVSGNWVPVPEPEHIHIEIEREYIPEDDYHFGKCIEYDGGLNMMVDGICISK